MMPMLAKMEISTKQAKLAIPDGIVIYFSPCFRSRLKKRLITQKPELFI